MKNTATLTLADGTTYTGTVNSGSRIWKKGRRDRIILTFELHHNDKGA